MKLEISLIFENVNTCCDNGDCVKSLSGKYCNLIYYLLIWCIYVSIFVELYIF